ncbi:MAG TPA: nickel pincer cofactor biosynthesis protein LarC [Methylomirabilota bacterium]|jgi:hypothetical protein
MKIAYFDCPSGASGDMILGALVDAGAPFESLERELAGLNVAGYRLECREVMKAGFRATKVDVHLDGYEQDPGYMGRAQGPRARHSTGHRDSGHRGLLEILEILEDSRLAPPVRDMASRVFRRMAAAEARVHGTTPERVQFHDVGAVDAIVDVTGSCIGLHLLGIDAIHFGALPVGGGFIEGPHGKMPVPGPATAEMLKGFPTLDTGIRRELVTPTGAAILTTLAAGAGAMPAMRVTAVGYGAGTMELDTPNVLRLFVGEAAASPPAETIVQVETTIDDMSPQLYEPLLERLLEGGALDAWLTPVIMKRSRPGIVLTALCEPGRVTELSRVLFEESSTIGVRWTAYHRARLDREMVRLDTTYGPVAFKVSRLEGRVVTVTPEFEEVRRIARDRGVAVREVLEQARIEGRRLLGGTP